MKDKPHVVRASVLVMQRAALSTLERERLARPAKRQLVNERVSFCGAS